MTLHESYRQWALCFLFGAITNSSYKPYACVLVHIRIHFWNVMYSAWVRTPPPNCSLKCHFDVPTVSVWDSVFPVLGIMNAFLFMYFQPSTVNHHGFILHFPVVNDAEHLFMCSFPICLSSLVKYLFISFAYFLIGLFF